MNSNPTHVTIDLAHGGHITVPLAMASVGFDGDETFWVAIPGGAYEIKTASAVILLDMIDMAGQVDDPRPYWTREGEVHPVLKGIAD